MMGDKKNSAGGVPPSAGQGAVSPEDFAGIIFEHLEKLLSATRSRRIVLAYSGGLDSGVLLDLLHRFIRERSSSFELLAVHINHGISANSDRWQTICTDKAARLGVAFAAESVKIPRTASVEAVAREHRYHTLKGYLDAKSLLCTAHHRDDQAETLLLNLLRGAGSAGLSAMASVSRFPPGWLARPLLGWSRDMIRTYAEFRNIDWVEDESNLDLDYSRNYIRHRIMPTLKARWPGCDATFARAARHQSTAQTILESESQRWLGRCLVGNALSRKACHALPAALRNPVLREWIASHGVTIPDSQKLAILWNNVIAADVRSGAAVEWSGVAFRFYRGLLHLIKMPEHKAPRGDIRWKRGDDLDIPELGMTLYWRDLVRQAPELDKADVSLRFRAGDERCGYDGGRHHHSLKKLFQQSGIPPWERERVPLVYADDDLRLVWNITHCK